jgi:4-phytase/acid phosphatase
MKTLAARLLLAALPILPGAATPLSAQSPVQASPMAQAEDAGELKFVVIVTRHGVRSPTGKIDELNRYSAQSWPEWTVPPGYLTEHGAKLMTLFGAYDRALFAKEGLFGADGCAGADQVAIVADSDQRTRETGKALAAGMFPGCRVEVRALAEGTHDPLFHPQGTVTGHPDSQLGTAALVGRIGNNPAGLVDAFRPQLQAMEDVLHACKPPAPCAAAPASLFDIPSSLTPGEGNRLPNLRTPLSTAATMAENLLLEYTEGMDKTQVGWGRVDLNKLRELMQIHTANADLTRRTYYLARIGCSNMLSHILASMEQAATAKPVAGALGKPEDRLLVVVGHDTNLSNISGALGLTWLIDGRFDDTPPGGALVFELRKNRTTAEYSVRTFYTAQTLDQMRNATPLTVQNPPERVPVFVPGCGRADGSCKWSAFQQTVEAVIIPDFAK